MQINEDIFRKIVETAQEGIWITDCNHFTTYVNKRMAEMLGYTKEEIIGQQFTDFLDKPFADLAIRNMFERCHTPKQKDVKFYCKNGMELWALVSFTYFYDEKGDYTGIFAMVTDITEQKMMAKSISQRIALEGAVAQSSRMFVSTEHVNVNEVLRILGESVSVQRAYIFFLRENGNKMDNIYEWCSPGTDPQIDNLQDLDSSIFLWWMGKLKGGENIVISDVNSLPPLAAAEKEILQAQEIKALLVVPIYSNDKELKGFMGFDDTKKCRAWSMEDAEALRVVAEMVGFYWERQRAEKALKDTNQLLEQIIESLPDATLVIDKNKKVIAWNRAMEEMTGVTKDAVISKGDYTYAVPFYGTKRPLLIDFIFSENKDMDKLYGFIERKGMALYSENFVPALYEGQGAFMWATASPLFDSEDNIIGAIESIRDITGRKKLEERLQYMATHDALTNIPNRYYLEEMLKRAAVKAKRDYKSALLIMDIDNFKLINDTLGHTAGDEILIKIVGVFKNNLRESDFLARLGGDEFAVLLEGIANQEDVLTIAERLRRAICENELCLIAHELCFNLSVSIGILIIDGIVEHNRFLSLADIALYAAKEGGRNRIVFAQPNEDITVKLTETNRLISLIKSALQENLFELNFQPIVRVSDENIVHYEVLIRLKDNNGQVVLPGKFIPVAENFGLMSQIDRWVVKAALATMRELPELHFFINISGVTLGDEAILDEIESNINSSGIKPSRIGFEITETAVVKDIFRAERWIRRLKDLGCLFALDDFGTGFSSFSYLRILPVDFIKIDGSFVHNVDREPAQRAMIQAIHNIANTLNKKTIAEFVENQNVLDVLRSIGIDYGQGFFLGKPEPNIKGHMSKEE